MRFPVPSSLKASGSSFCGETVRIGFIVLACKHYSLTKNGTQVAEVIPFQSQSEVRIDLQRHNLQPTETNKIVHTVREIVRKYFTRIQQLLILWEDLGIYINATKKNITFTL